LDVIGILSLVFFTFFILINLKAFVALCLFLLVFAGKSFAQQHNNYNINGFIMDSVSQKPLVNAKVVLLPSKNIVYTNDRGFFQFNNLAKTNYKMEVSYLGYHPIVLNLVLPLKTSLRIDLASEEHHLHDVVINTDKNNKLSDYNLQNHVTIDSKKLDILRGQTLGDMLKNTAGVTLLNSGPSISKPVIRGLHSNRIVTLNNGVKQEGQNWGADHGPEIDPFAINKLEVIKGASGLQYGPEAIGGVIKVSAKDFKTQNGIAGMYSLNGFSNNWQLANSLFLEGNHFKKQNLSWRLQTSYRKAGDSQTPEYVLSNTAFTESDINAAVQYQLKQNTFEYMASYFQSSLGILRSAHVHNRTDLENTIARGKPSVINDFTYEIGRPRQDITHFIQAFKWIYSFKNANKLSVFFSQQINNRQEFDVLSFLNANSNLKDQPTYNLTLTTNQFNLKLEHKKVFGFKGLVGFSYANQGNYATGKQFFIPNFISNNYGFYVIEKWNKKHWQAEAGLRYDLMDLTRYINQNNQVLSNVLNYNNAACSAGISYLFNTKWKLTTNLSSAWRPPSINELYANGLHAAVATFEQGNANLKPEQSYNAEVTLKYVGATFDFDFTAYNNLINNFIYRLPSNIFNTSFRGVFPVFNYVQTNALLQGFETNLNYKLRTNLSINAAYTFLYANDISKNLPLIFMPANRINSGIEWQLTKLKKVKNTFVQINYQYVFKQNRVPEGIDFTDSPASYQLFDLIFGASQFTKVKMNWSVGVQNIFNTSYRDYLSRYRYYALDTGRNIFLKLNIPF
jgi:iron complex outermembrane receptor protein